MTPCWAQFVRACYDPWFHRQLQTFFCLRRAAHGLPDACFADDCGYCLDRPEMPAGFE